MMDIAGCISRFLNYSPKQQLLLENHIAALYQSDPELPKRKKLKDLCKTRWAERHNAFEAFSELYVAVVYCLEEMTAAAGWNRETVSSAQSHLRVLLEFKLLITVNVTKNVLAYTKGLSIKLQGRWQDIVRAVENINSVKETIKDARANVDEFHST